eukprot:9970713-Ditylum_brightwellii.AAC.1
MGGSFFNTTCEDTIHILQDLDVTVPVRNSTSMEKSQLVKQQEYQMMQDIDELIPGVINRNSLSDMRSSKRANTGPIRITLLGESIGYNPTNADDFPIIQSISNMAIGGFSAIAYWVCKSSEASQYEYCTDIKESTSHLKAKQVMSSIEMTKPDIVVIHDSHWSLHTETERDYKRDVIPLGTSYERIMAFNSLIADAINNTVRDIYYLNQSPVLKFKSKYKYMQEVDYFMQMVDTLTCRDDNGSSDGVK